MSVSIYGLEHGVVASVHYLLGLMFFHKVSRNIMKNALVFLRDKKRVWNGKKEQVSNIFFSPSFQVCTGKLMGIKIIHTKAFKVQINIQVSVPSLFFVQDRLHSHISDVLFTCRYQILQQLGLAEPATIGNNDTLPPLAQVRTGTLAQPCSYLSAPLLVATDYSGDAVNGTGGFALLAVRPPLRPTRRRGESGGAIARTRPRSRDATAIGADSFPPCVRPPNKTGRDAWFLQCQRAPPGSARTSAGTGIESAALSRCSWRGRNGEPARQQQRQLPPPFAAGKSVYCPPLSPGTPKRHRRPTSRNRRERSP